MHRIVGVKPLKNYKLWLEFSDGVRGNVDLSHLVGKGVFSVWKDPKFFKSVFIDTESGTIAWEGGIDLCPDTLYAEIRASQAGTPVIPGKYLPSAMQERASGPQLLYEGGQSW